ncbi:unnamed protein product [Ilex paraguariensis]|uniref:Uncharacterized protein n=1 Tax=Ilex paraguariensis TaxID=185542 RepID=A0ABC8U1A7_9AQUA
MQMIRMCCLILTRSILFFEQLQQLVVENVPAFNENLWIWLAAKMDTCKSEDDKARFVTNFFLQKDYEELALFVVSLVDRLVHKTNVMFVSLTVLKHTLHPIIGRLLQRKIYLAIDVLKVILKPVVDEKKEISWPPRDPEAFIFMEKVRFYFLLVMYTKDQSIVNNCPESFIYGCCAALGLYLNPDGTILHPKEKKNRRPFTHACL